MAYTLNATKRTLQGEKSRVDGLIPAVVYGAGSTTESLSVSYKDFAKLYKEASESTLVDLMVDGQPTGKILVHEVQFNPINDQFIHVDFRRIDMNKPITATVVVKFTGEAPVVKAMGGTLVHNINEIHVKCLPKDLPEQIIVDVSVLKTFEDMIKVKNLAIPAGVEVLSPPLENVVAKVQRALTEDEIKAMEEASKTADISKIELAKKKEAEEGVVEGEEGAATAKPGDKAPEKKDEKKGDKK
ncbi:MAG: 50S ribosomal protein L25 [Candidatus Magasanikbacteria bacterium]|jgi:large subunit ribosomal protein L25